MDNNRRQNWHDRQIPELAAQLATDPLCGLTPDDAVQRLHTGGTSEFARSSLVGVIRPAHPP